MWPLAVPLISAAGSALGSLFGGAASAAQSASDAAVQKENVDKTNAANAQMAQNAFDQNHKMWLENNAYNSPEQQMARLKAAGLNPNLVYGQGAVGNSSGSIPQFQAPRQSYDYKNPIVAGQIPATISSFLNLQMQQAQLDNVRASTAATQTKAANDALTGQFLRGTMDDRITGAGLNSVKLNRALADYGLNYGDYFDGKRSVQFKGFTGLAGSQLAAAQFAAKRAQLTNDKIFQDMDRQKMLNEWLRMGVTPGDNFLLRGGARSLPNVNAWLDKFFGN